MRAFTLIALVPFALGISPHPMLNLDCTEYPGPCNNNCYAAYVANKPLILTYNGPDGKSGGRRSAAGCVSPSPCRNDKMKKPTQYDDTCDEYPYASVEEGGPDAIIRCTRGHENSKEGRDLSSFFRSTCGNKRCTFRVNFGNPGGGNTPYCLNGGGANDGYQYSYKGRGKYELASRDFDSTEDSELALHEPDPADFFEPHLRREFLLEDGSRTVLSSRDQTASYDDTVFYSVRNGTVVETRAVKELLGEEKSPELQHPSLRRKRELQFAS
ncbi:hypothetical protein P168DRAFT_280092 [Aspergillus campestris IBT 28561]|uniref:Deoxyribonuclease NucA/NucB domain-containing protein n=1 Tax=Aspergillus campestris (strain IBT 28561) TaxID=1392248 RepID=A0A2I1D9Z5_ASPC2|nr:uncharacterized protein P168DRAFT_280092 [Aspergillus campestris IBT 28561]PKY06704.1 hypothetical protein P168DRAFT_280092 [Aspergillus campestris IBT 28561]